MHDFFGICVSLYGCLSLRQAWNIYQILMREQNAPKVSLSEMNEYVDVARRDICGYWVFKASEVWIDGGEAREDWEIIGFSCGDFQGAGNLLEGFYKLNEQQLWKPFYIPENFLNYSYRRIPEEMRLLTFIGNLRSTASTVDDDGGLKVENPWKDMILQDFRLDENKFDFLISAIENLNPDKTAENESFISDIKDSLSLRSAADEIVFSFLQGLENPFLEDVEDAFSLVYEMLEKIGVELSVRQNASLYKYLIEFAENVPLIINRGYSEAGLDAWEEEYGDENPGWDE